MSEKPTGVFVRLPLSKAARELLVDAAAFGKPDDSHDKAILAIGTPATGGKEICAGSVKWHENDVEPVLETYVPNTFGKGASVKIVTLSDHQAQIAALEAEVVRLRERYGAIRWRFIQDAKIEGRTLTERQFDALVDNDDEAHKALQGGAA